MFDLNETDYDRSLGVVVLPDSNVTSIFGDKKYIKYDPDIGKDNKEFTKEFFKTGLLEAFFDKNSALEWPTGYMDSLTPEQRFTPIRMLFNDVMDESVGFNEKNVLALNNFRGLRKVDNQLIIDRALPIEWFYKGEQGTDASQEAVKLSKLMLGMFAAEQVASKTTNPSNYPEYINPDKFEQGPRLSVDLSIFAATQNEVQDRLDDLDNIGVKSGRSRKWYHFLNKDKFGKDVNFDGVLDFTQISATDTGLEPYTEEQQANQDELRRKSLL